MAHLTPEQLALLALGGSPVDPGHLDGCESCRAEAEALRAVAAVGAETQEVRDLPPPPPAVWEAIAARVSPANGTTTRTRPAEPSGRPGTVSHDRTGPGGPPSGGSGPGRRARRRWTRLATTAVLAALLGVVGTLGVTRLLARDAATTPPTDPAVVARAGLAALPTAPSGAGGEARVLGSPQAATLHLHVTGLPLQRGYYEVWLIDPDTMEMVSLGQLGDPDNVLLPIATTTDLRKYRLVDISAEEYDNVQAHSGRSLLRGQLTT